MSFRSGNASATLRAAFRGTAVLMGAALLPVQGWSEQSVIEEIVVTATKRSESIQDVASSVSQISGDDMQTRGITDVENLAAFVPNLTFGKFGTNTFVTIRGIGTTVDSGIAEPAVATYVDGVFLSRTTMAITRQADMERVEVLRGPQGTLYGRNATGGAINFISRAPSTEWEGGGRLTFEERSGRILDTYLSGPLGEHVAFRLSGGIEEQDGYVKIVNNGGDLLNRDLWYARGALQITPSDSVTIDLSVYREEDDGRNATQVALTPPTNVLGIGALLGAPVNFTTSENRIFTDGPASGQSDTTLVSARVNWDINDTLSFRSVTGYVDHFVDSQFDADSTDFFFVDLDGVPRDSTTFTQELNLIGENERISWLVGAYFFQEEFDYRLPLSFPGFVLGAPLAPRVPVLAGDVFEETRSIAVFGDASYAFTDQLSLNVGLRFNSEEKEFDFFGAASPAGRFEANDVLPKIGLEYAVNENANVYGHWQRGIKSGGHQLDRPQQFEPEALDAYEIGVKSQFMDGKLTINAAAFYYDYEDLQATITIPPSTTLIENGDAEVLGFEGELFYMPVSNINLNLGLSFLDSEYTDLTSTDQSLPGAPVVDLDGEELIRAPGFTINAGAEWVISVPSDLIGSIRLRADVFHSDEYKLAFIDYAETRQDAYTTLDLSITLADPSDRFTIRAFLDNATDEVFLNTASFLATTSSFIGLQSEPRVAGVTLSAKF